MPAVGRSQKPAVSLIVSVVNEGRDVATVQLATGHMKKVIANTKVVCVTGKGERLPVTVSIGQPYQGEDGLWVCPLSLEGLYQRLSPMKSDDSLHALCLSIFLARNLLMEFIDEGGRVLIAESQDEDFPMDAYFSPPLPRNPG